MLPQALISGILVFQVLYSLVQWYFFKRKEYIYYAAYSILTGLYFLLKYTVVDNEVHIGSVHFPERIIDRDLVFIAICLYVEFGRTFLNGADILPALDRKMGIVNKMLLVYTILNLCWYILSDQHAIQELVHFAVSLAAFTYFIYGMLRVFEINKKLVSFLFIGSVLMGSGALLSLFLRVFRPDWSYGALHAGIFFQIGVILELICLNTGLIYKSKLMLDARAAIPDITGKKNADHEKLLSDLQSVRSEISDELKSELGDGLSGIKLMSDMIKQKMGNNHFIELERISENSEKLIQSMNEIVWSLNHQSDNLPGMISYLREYTMNFMQQVGIECNIIITEPVKDLYISSDARRHIFLAVKESLHNAIKHASATEVSIVFNITDKLEIGIADNGKGMEDTSMHTLKGNGLRNMRKRMGHLGGTMHISSSNGTMVLFSIPLALIQSNSQQQKTAHTSCKDDNNSA